jgi:hypothetical protein
VLQKGKRRNSELNLKVFPLLGGMQRIQVVVYRCFGAAYRCHFQGSSNATIILFRNAFSISNNVLHFTEVQIMCYMFFDISGQIN